MGHCGLLTQLSSHIQGLLTLSLHSSSRDPQSCYFTQQVSAVNNPTLAKDGVHETQRSLVVLPKVMGLGCGYWHEIIGLVNSVVKLIAISKAPKLHLLNTEFVAIGIKSLV